MVPRFPVPKYFSVSQGYDLKVQELSRVESGSYAVCWFCSPRTLNISNCYDSMDEFVSLMCCLQTVVPKHAGMLSTLAVSTGSVTCCLKVRVWEPLGIPSLTHKTVFTDLNPLSGTLTHTDTTLTCVMIANDLHHAETLATVISLQNPRHMSAGLHVTHGSLTPPRQQLPSRGQMLPVRSATALCTASCCLESRSSSR